MVAPQFCDVFSPLFLFLVPACDGCVPMEAFGVRKLLEAYLAGRPEAAAAVRDIGFCYLRKLSESFKAEPGVLVLAVAVFRNA